MGVSCFFVHFRKLFLNFSRKVLSCILYIERLSSEIRFVCSISLVICLCICGGAISARGYNFSTGVGFKQSVVMRIVLFCIYLICMN